MLERNPKYLNQIKMYTGLMKNCVSYEKNLKIKIVITSQKWIFLKWKNTCRFISNKEQYILLSTDSVI